MDPVSTFSQTQPIILEEAAKNSTSLFQQNNFLLNLFGEKGIPAAISCLRKDRFSNSQTLIQLLKQVLPNLPQVNEELIEEEPLFSLLVLILNNDPSEDILRDYAADCYIKNHGKEDPRFEKGYAYLKTPHILIAHLLLITSQWQCSNPENQEFYDEQMAGLFQGTMCFDKGDHLSPEELLIIQRQEGENPRFPIAKKLEKKGDYFEVKAWCATPPLCNAETRLDDLFIPSRRIQQEAVVAGYLDQLKESSSILQKKYGLPLNLSAVVAIIGPYGVGKSHFTQSKFSEAKITSFNLDILNSLLMGVNSRPQDHHFEAMVLKSKLLPMLSEVPALFTEAAAIDEVRFNLLVDRDYARKDLIIIEEIAPEKTSDAVNRLTRREGELDQSRLGAATTSANDALRYRKDRIEKVKENPKIHYTLYCNPTNGGSLIEVAKKQDGVFSIIREDLYQKLVNG